MSKGINMGEREGGVLPTIEYYQMKINNTIYKCHKIPRLTKKFKKIHYVTQTQFYSI